MKRLAFKMKLFPGKETEYQQRHDSIWPELSELLKQHGVSEYTIFLDKHSLDLFGALTIQDQELFEKLPHSPVMQKWWQYMKDIMETNADGSPVTVPLTEVFYMP
jgi:L-rhamnose mutarotase